MKKMSQVRQRSRASSEVPMVRCRRIANGACSKEDMRKIQKTVSSVGICCLYISIGVCLLLQGVWEIVLGGIYRESLPGRWAWSVNLPAAMKGGRACRIFLHISRTYLACSRPRNAIEQAGSMVQALRVSLFHPKVVLKAASEAVPPAQKHRTLCILQASISMMAIL